jgi:hypothetical protein
VHTRAVPVIASLIGEPYVSRFYAIQLSRRGYEGQQTMLRHAVAMLHVMLHVDVVCNVVEPAQWICISGCSFIVSSSPGSGLDTPECCPSVQRHPPRPKIPQVTTASTFML